jgi:hypothetical protein
MGLQHEVKGVGNRGGIFFAGRPTTLLAFDDGIVLLPSSTVGGLLGAQGAVGALGKAMHDKRQTSARADKADELDAAGVAGTKRASVMPYGEIMSARLHTGRVQNKITLETAAGERYLRYPKKVWPEAEATEFMSARLGERFAQTED